MSMLRLGGLTSGMETQTIVEQLMVIERKPLEQLQKRQLQIELKKGLFSEINSSLSALSSKLETLFKTSTFNPMKVTSTDESVISVTSDDDAFLGTYGIKVNSLASPSTAISSTALDLAPDTAALITSSGEVNSQSDQGIDTSQTFAAANWDAGFTLGSGTITINEVNFTINSEVTTIDQFMQLVNSNADVGVNISYDDEADQFILKSRGVGSSAIIEIEDETGFLQAAKLSETDTLTVKGAGTIDPETKLIDSGLMGLNAVDNVISFTLNDVNFSFDVTEDSLNDVIREINQSTAGVTAFYDSDQDKVFFSSRDTASGDIEFTDTVGTFKDALKITEINSATAASFELNGIAMTKNSNEFEINGVTFNLLKPGTSTVTVKKDEDAVYNSIKEFVDQYNSTITLLNTRLSEARVEEPTTEAAMKKGLLRADSTLISIRNQLRSVSYESVEGLSNTFTSLRAIGITTSDEDYGKTGKLEIDEDKLREAIKNNPDAVKNLFLKDTDQDDKVDDGELGVAAKMYNILDSYTSTSNRKYAGKVYKTGIIPMRIDSLEDQVKSYETQIEDYETRLELVEERYWNQFNAMESALAKLNNQSSWFMSQVETLPTGLF